MLYQYDLILKNPEDEIFRQGSKGSERLDCVLKIGSKDNIGISVDAEDKLGPAQGCHSPSHICSKHKASLGIIAGRSMMYSSHKDLSFN